MASGGTFESAAAGTFQNVMGGTFVSATPGTFDCAMGGTFNPLLTIKIPKYLNGLSNQGKKAVASITATLCYSFDPIMSNFLSYNPIHISFAFFKPLNDDLSKSIDIIAGYTSKQKQDHPELKELAERTKREREFKSGVRWSEDYSPIDSMQFSNTQKISIPFRICDLVSTNNELNLVIRCATKKNIDPLELLRIQEKEHPFSLVIRIEEKEIDGKLSGKLYSNLQLINTLEAIAEADVEVEV